MVQLSHMWANTLERGYIAKRRSLAYIILWSRVLGFSAEDCCLFYQANDWWLMGSATGRGIFVALAHELTLTAICDNLSFQTTLDNTALSLACDGSALSDHVIACVDPLLQCAHLSGRSCDGSLHLVQEAWTLALSATATGCGYTVGIEG